MLSIRTSLEFCRLVNWVNSVSGNKILALSKLNAFADKIDWMVFYAAFNSISVISRRQLTLFMLSWVSPVLG